MADGTADTGDMAGIELADAVESIPNQLAEARGPRHRREATRSPRRCAVSPPRHRHARARRDPRVFPAPKWTALSPPTHVRHVDLSLLQAMPGCRVAVTGHASVVGGEGLYLYR